VFNVYALFSLLSFLSDAFFASRHVPKSTTGWIFVADSTGELTSLPRSLDHSEF